MGGNHFNSCVVDQVNKELCDTNQSNVKQCLTQE